MRTKHLLLALAVPALFAACQQDDFTTEGVNTNALQGRKSIGQVTFVTNEGAETRWHKGEDYNEILPDLSDGLSVNLVDIPAEHACGASLLDGEHQYAIDNYKLVDYVNTNYKYTRNSGNTGWTNEGNLVEGNYVIVAPYIATQSRKPLEVVLPARQTVNVKDGKPVQTSALENVWKAAEAPFAIAYKFLEADRQEKNISLEYQSIFSYPLITIKNTWNAANPLYLSQVVIENPDGFTLRASIDADGVRKAMINQVFKREGAADKALLGSWTGAGMYGVNTPGNLGEASDEYNAKGGANSYLAPVPFAYVTKEDGTREQSKTTYLGLKYWSGSYWETRNTKYDTTPWSASMGWTEDKAPATSDLLATKDAETTNYIVVDFDEPVKIDYLDKIDFNVVMPAETYSNEAGKELKIYAVFKDNNVTWVKTIRTNTTVTTLPGKRYPRQAYSEPQLGKPELNTDPEDFFVVYTNNYSDQHGTYKEALGDNDFAKPYVTVVKTQEELVAAVKANANADRTIVVEGEGLVWNAEVNKQVAASKTQKLNVQGRITIGDDTSIVIKNYVSFENAIIDGAVTIGDSNANEAGSALGKVLVTRNGSLTLYKLDGGTKPEIVNAGALNIRYDNEAEVVNFGTLNVYCRLYNTVVTNATDRCEYDNDGWGELLSSTISLDPRVYIQKGGTYRAHTTISYQIYVYAGGTLEIAGTTMLDNYMLSAPSANRYNNSTYGYIWTAEKTTAAGASKITGIEDGEDKATLVLNENMNSEYLSIDKTTEVTNLYVHYNNVMEAPTENNPNPTYEAALDWTTYSKFSGVSFGLGVILTVGSYDEPFEATSWANAMKEAQWSAEGKPSESDNATAYGWFLKKGTKEPQLIVMTTYVLEASNNRASALWLEGNSAYTVNTAAGVEEIVLHPYNGPATGTTVNGTEETLTTNKDTKVKVTE